MVIFSRPLTRLGLFSQMRYKKPSKPWQNFEQGKKFRRNLWLMNGGILLSVFAACYMVVPLYRSFCQAAGLIGDDMQKDYSAVIKDNKNSIIS